MHAYADALVAPDFKDAGLLDTAVVTIRFDNGAIATAEASFSAAYGYDVRGEFFGSAGMVTAGTPAHLATAHWTAAGLAQPTVPPRHRAHARLLPSRARGVLPGRPRRAKPSPVTGADARAALEVALTAVASVEQGAPVRLARRRWPMPELARP